MMNTRGHILHLHSTESARPPAIGARIRNQMRPWGLTITDIAMEMGVSRQYIWQVLYGKTPVSERKASEVSRYVERLIERQKTGASTGERLRRARIAAGMTLKAAAAEIGYTWVAVERWEKNVCLPKPGVLWHLRHVYGVGEDWLPASHPPDDYSLSMIHG
jgi:transcriptional regulator with XRE-family HTH domain